MGSCSAKKRNPGMGDINLIENSKPQSQNQKILKQYHKLSQLLELIGNTDTLDHKTRENLNYLIVIRSNMSIIIQHEIKRLLNATQPTKKGYDYEYLLFDDPSFKQRVNSQLQKLIKQLEILENDPEFENAFPILRYQKYNVVCGNKNQKYNFMIINKIMYQFRSSIYYEPSDSGSVKSVQVGNAKQDQVRYLTDQLQAVIMYNEKIEKEISTLKQQNQQLKQGQTEKDKQIQEAQEQQSKAINKLHVLLQENQKLQEIVIATNKHLKNAQTKIVSIQHENNTLKQQIQQQEEYHVEEMKKRANELEEHYQLMQTIVADLTQQVTQLCEEKQKLQLELENKSQQ